MSATAASVRLVHAGAISTVTLARASMGNALVPDLLLDLCVSLEEVGRRDETRVVLLAAEGESFSIGADLRRLAREMQGAALASYSAEYVGLLNQAIVSLLRLPQPIVGVVHGAVAGAAIGLVLGCDVVVAAHDCRFDPQYARAGFAPDGGWTALLPQVVGRRRAAACLLLDRALQADEALACGLVTQLTVREGVVELARDIARRIAAAPRTTVYEGKRLLAGDLDAIEQALEAERERFVATVSGADAREGLARFLDSCASYPGA
ncbi:MAG: enoyl-CoA hydratase/isomerase family protein [Burkholderiaceae bacterium]|nr:enoyl-CoA hydratase/isomerase family protein [Burkholderiaceae bacterium]